VQIVKINVQEFKRKEALAFAVAASEQRRRDEAGFDQSHDCDCSEDTIT
jgi:hypothetical protein